jgi:hypothetical protein
MVCAIKWDIFHMVQVYENLTFFQLTVVLAQICAGKSKFISHEHSGWSLTAVQEAHIDTKLWMCQTLWFYKIHTIFLF